MANITDHNHTLQPLRWIWGVRPGLQVKSPEGGTSVLGGFVTPSCGQERAETNPWQKDRLLCG